MKMQLTIPMILFSLLKTQKYMFLFKRQKFLAKDLKDQFIGLKDQFIGMNIKQKVRIEIQQTYIDTFWDQILLELIDYLFQFIQTKSMILKYLKLEDITYHKELLIIITLSSMEKTFKTKQLIQI